MCTHTHLSTTCASSHEQVCTTRIHTHTTDKRKERLLVELVRGDLKSTRVRPAYPHPQHRGVQPHTVMSMCYPYVCLHIGRYVHADNTCIYKQREVSIKQFKILGWSSLFAFINFYLKIILQARWW